MKIVCAKADLLAGVNTVGKAVPAKTTMAILQCILLDASAGEIKLTGNDMELGIETIVKGRIEEKGIIALDAKIFSDIIRKMPEGDVTIETDDQLNTTISCEKTTLVIIGKRGDDFSYLPYIEKENPVVISQFSLKEIVRQTIFSISDNDTNKLMTGELFEINENELRVAALDGHRIAIRKIVLKDHYENKKVVIPGKTLQEVSKILNGGVNDDVYLYFSKNHVVFEFENTTVVSRLIEGEYFMIDSMLSSSYETLVEVNRKNLMDCIDRATLLVKENDKKPIIMKIGGEKIEMKINSFIGSMNEEIDITKEGSDLMIGFNPRFFLDALRVIDEETVLLYMTNSKSPCYIKNKEESFIYLILPVNFNSASY